MWMWKMACHKNLFDLVGIKTQQGGKRGERVRKTQLY